MACNTTPFTLGVRNVIIGKNSKQKFCIKAKADVAGSLAGKYFIVHAPTTQAKHYFWMDDGVAADPAVPSATGHAISFTTGDSASDVATAIGTALTALTTLFDSATVSAEHVDVTLKDNGYAYEARDSMVAADQTGFKITIASFGRLQADAGPTNGDITLTIEEQTQEVTAPQTGDYVLAEIRRGVRVSMSFELKSTAAANIRDAINYYGGTFVTDDSSASVISGYGTKNLYKSTDDVASQVILRELDYAEANDASQDFTLHKAKLKLGEMTLSAENELVLPIEVVGYLDKTKYSGLNMFTYGDASKVPAV